MHFHPKDTEEAFKPADRGKIAHLWYHLHYNQMIQEVKNGKIEYSPDKKKPAPRILPELSKLGKTVEKGRQRAIAEMNASFHIRQLRATALSRIIPGMGAGHVKETSLTLHPVYGFPYIPASSVKGLVRHWFIHAYCEGDESKLADNEWGKAVFGSQENRGAVQFYDIYLHEQLQIEADILTVHFKEYYSGGNTATDSQKPNPVPFWTVNVKEANIFLTVPKGIKTAISSDDLIQAAASWTCRAFKELGIGSKSALGYGLFSEVTDVTKDEFEIVIAGQEERIEKQRKERLRKMEIEGEAREQEAIAARLEKMTKEERLLYEIQSLSSSQADQDKSKNALFEEVLSQKNAAAASALKAYWETNGQWKIKKQQKKQYNKVQEVKKLLQL
ncbi:type III-B CRISPR module RAMP protein Cmr6 [Bacillus sp. DTU_2020_1000418_1_SI_GHA_SEK_038]|uniref:type III-B CRISPR module RAMP protein Cmr6 n=1 Tax=Bacillus sp. DTU_2020_1000418_1_SI_GHA_SEK_038 TaxID=3077585 RepID=UPI0028EEBCB9|nr:type III-B CRISPR module RAMP protein Cmr6 [Bacillus sp. DTU_2020_1000418_1_SI_GHA_SEK_038]WNS77425.1 type III-B CRISPR module RAMP protein Cmr6 [Bacillus sp. DTU_2020_1000418_1_SI_GHA_SEK_038]